MFANITLLFLQSNNETFNCDDVTRPVLLLLCMDEMADNPLKITHEQREAATLFQEALEQG